MNREYNEKITVFHFKVKMYIEVVVIVCDEKSWNETVKIESRKCLTIPFR